SRRPRDSVLCRNAPVPIVESDDVVFAEVAAALHFDQQQWHGAGILEAMPVLGGDESRLVLAQREVALAIRDARFAAHDDPMLAAMAVELQRQRRTGLHFDALDLEAWRFLQHGVGTPGPQHGLVNAISVVPSRFELADNLL